MTSERRKLLALPVTLCIVSMIMGLLIVGVYMLTKDEIAAQTIAAREAARRSVMPAAADMTALPAAEGAAVDECFEAFDPAGEPLGYVAKVTVIGFGGEIEVTVGMDMAGAVTGVSVGGENFSETSGLGAKTRDAAFTDQFMGKSGTLLLKRDIDSVTGASISSSAVVSAVNKALAYMTALLPEPAQGAEPAEELPLDEATLQTLLPGATTLVYMGGGSGIDAWWQADNGYIVQATGFGLGPIVVKVGMAPDGTVLGILIGDESFMESEVLGAKMLEESYWSQFLGRRGVQAYGDDLDGISGATVSSNAVLGAINACLGFVPGEAEAEPASGESSGDSSAEPSPSPTPAADAVTQASATATPAPSGSIFAPAATASIFAPAATPEPNAPTAAAEGIFAPAATSEPYVPTATASIFAPASAPEPSAAAPAATSENIFAPVQGG